jgi:hypothetical protein
MIMRQWVQREKQPLHEQTRFLVEPSKARIERLSVVLEGYRELSRYLFFVLIFFTVLYLQTDPSRSYALVNQLKTTLMQTDAALVAEVRSVESLFKYFVGEIEEAAAAAEDDEEGEDEGGKKKKKKKKKRGKGGGGGGAKEIPLIPTLFPDGYYNIKADDTAQRCLSGAAVPCSHRVWHACDAARCLITRARGGVWQGTYGANRRTKGLCWR